MGYKSRSNYLVTVCFKDCEHKDTVICEECFRFSKYKKKGVGNEDKQK